MHLIKRFVRILSVRVTALIEKTIRRYKPKQYSGTSKIHSVKSGNRQIYNSILECEDRGLMISRFGSTELNTILNYLQLENRVVSSWSPDVKKDMQIASGFFPATDEALETFSKIYLNSIKSIDILGVWYRQKEDFIIKNYCPNAYLTGIQALEPYFFQDPWSKILKGKKVLVIHPFEYSIRKQYAKRQFLFKNDNVLPEFKLETLKSVQSLACNQVDFEDWFSALEWMKRSIKQIDFDIAIIGCGAYGLPLAAYVKELGKIGFHLGGATQILFGIKGKRWDGLPKISSLYNSYWTRPHTEETPKLASSVEEGCYW